MPYTSITDIAAANSAIAELYGQTDALMRRAGELTLGALGGAPLNSPAFTGNPVLPFTTKFAAQGGGEGGQFMLEKAPTGSTLSGNTVVDAYGNRIRFFEEGGNARGAYLDLTQCANSAASVIYHSGNFSPANYLPLSGGGMTGSVWMRNTYIQDGEPALTMQSLYEPSNYWFQFKFTPNSNGENLTRLRLLTHSWPANDSYKIPIEISADGQTYFNQRTTHNKGLNLPYNYTNPCFIVGSVYMWIENNTGRLRWKIGAPNSDNDGQMFALV